MGMPLPLILRVTREGAHLKRLESLNLHDGIQTTFLFETLLLDHLTYEAKQQHNQGAMRRQRCRGYQKPGPGWLQLDHVIDEPTACGKGSPGERTFFSLSCASRMVTTLA